MYAPAMVLAPLDMVNDRRSGPLEPARCCATTAPLQLLLLLHPRSDCREPAPCGSTHAKRRRRGSALEREATDASTMAEYDQVLKLWQSLPPESTASKPLIRLAFQSSSSLGD